MKIKLGSRSSNCPTAAEMMHLGCTAEESEKLFLYHVVRGNISVS